MKLTKTERIDGLAEINGARITLNCEWVNGAVPTKISVNGNYNGDGQGSTLSRTYQITDEVISYTPISKDVIYPFNADFNAKLLVEIDNIFTNYATL